MPGRGGGRGIGWGGVEVTCDETECNPGKNNDPSLPRGKEAEIICSCSVATLR